MEIAAQVDQDASLEVLLVMAWHDYQAAPRDRQKALWSKLALLLEQQTETQSKRAALRLVRTHAE